MVSLLTLKRGRHKNYFYLLHILYLVSFSNGWNKHKITSLDPHIFPARRWQQDLVEEKYLDLKGVLEINKCTTCCRKINIKIKFKNLNFSGVTLRRSQNDKFDIIISDNMPICYESSNLVLKSIHVRNFKYKITVRKLRNVIWLW